MLKHIAIGLTMLVSCAAVHANQITIVGEGEPNAVVVIADDPSKTAEYAAKELVWHIARGTGVELDVIRESDVADDRLTRIYVGMTSRAEESLRSTKLGPDVACIRVVEGDLFILGEENDEDPLDTRNNRVGTLFGVYEILERVLDVRWLWPGELGTYVPSTKHVSISADLDKVIEPALSHRFIWDTVQWRSYRTTEERARYLHDRAVFDRRHRLGQTEAAPSPAHSFRDWWGRYGEDHPEWFTLSEDGERVGLGLCVSNASFHDYIVNGREEHASDGRVWHSSGDWIRLGDLDSDWNPCQCFNCRAWDGPIPQDPSFARGLYDRFGWFGVSDRYARFYQTIYEKASQQFPDIKVAGYLYWSYLSAPTTDIQVSENVYGHFVPWGTGGIIYFPISEEAMQWLKDQWLGWRNTGMSLIYRPNHWNGGYIMPHMSRQGGDFFKWAYENGMAGFKFDRYYDHWGIKGPMLYMYLRLFANPEGDIDQIMDGYYEAFGPAADHIQTYVSYWEEYSKQRSGGSLYHTPNAAVAFPEEAFMPAVDILDAAMEAARTHPNEQYADRVEFLSNGLEHALLASRFWASLNRRSATASEIPQDPREREAAVRAFAELEKFRHRHGASYIVNFGAALRLERRGVDTGALREAVKELDY